MGISRWLVMGWFFAVFSGCPVDPPDDGALVVFVRVLDVPTGEVAGASDQAH